MRPELERLQRIEHHVLGAAHPGQVAEWALQQLFDAELEADTQAQQLVYHALHLAGRRQLYYELQQIHEQLYGPRPSRWRQLAALGRLATQKIWLKLRRK